MRRVPRSEARPPRRLSGALKPGAMTGGAVKYEIVSVFNASNVRYRCKGDQAFSVDIIPLATDTDPDYSGALTATLPGTQLTTGGKLANAQTANTEGKIDLATSTGELFGEAYHLVKVTWGGTPGNLNFIEVYQIVPSGNA